jgi:hypothetical protein
LNHSQRLKSLGIASSEIEIRLSGKFVVVAVRVQKRWLCPTES